MPGPRRGPAAITRAISADLRACARCGGLVDTPIRICPHCGQWLGPGAFWQWLGLVIVGSVLIVLAFYLPWLNGVGDAAGQSLSGYDLAQIALRLAAGNSAGARPTAAASIALYMAPTTGAVILTLVILTRVWHLRWSLVGRLIVGLAAMPLQLALLTALFALGLLGETATRNGPHVGLIVTGLGSLLAIAGGMTLGGPGRALLTSRHLALPARGDTVAIRAGVPHPEPPPKQEAD